MSLDKNQGYVNFNINDIGIATIEFGHPMSNSLPGKILSKLAETVTQHGNDDQVKVIVLTSGESIHWSFLISPYTNSSNAFIFFIVYNFFYLIFFSLLEKFLVPFNKSFFFKI